ncbi:MAG TPA: DUF92 domain-containing protein [Gemmatimonadales bacterium]|nr:DUF92 domain-containing protein [Gemmatimonadales bacterium]
MSPAAAAAIAVLLALGARAAGWFTGPAAALGGALAGAVLLGTGLGGFLLFGLFVVSGALLSRRGPPRRAAQVLANGWTAAAGAALAARAPELGWAVLAGGLAAAQADTWATEIGQRRGGVPVLLTSGRPVAPGASGGVTRLGTGAGILGAALAGAVALAAGYDSRLAPAVAVAGTAGMLLDSLLGATVQATYSCTLCRAPSDAPRHCGTPARLVGGRPWITNDVVNAAATGCGATLAALAVALR